MSRRLCTILRASLLALPLLASPPAAALSRSMTLDEVFTQGDAVFVGRVVSARAVWGEGRKMIWTEYTFEVQESWKGAGPSRRVVRVAGGTLDGTSIQLSHVPAFEAGATYVLSAFENDRLYASPVVGTEQGIFREVIEETTGESLLVDAGGRRLEKDPSGRLVRGAPSVAAAIPGFVRLVSEREAAMREESAAPVRLAEPTWRDASGNAVARPATRVARPRNATPLRFERTSVTRDSLRAHVARLLGKDAR